LFNIVPDIAAHVFFKVFITKQKLNLNILCIPRGQLQLLENLWVRLQFLWNDIYLTLHMLIYLKCNVFSCLWSYAGFLMHFCSAKFGYSR